MNTYTIVFVQGGIMHMHWHFPDFLYDEGNLLWCSRYCLEDDGGDGGAGGGAW